MNTPGFGAPGTPESVLTKQQLNTVVSTGMINKIRKLAAEFSVPRYAVTEYLLETGHFYVSLILKNRKKREILREHLIDRHMLDNGYDDPEELLRIGEGRYASGLISLAKSVIRDFRVLERLLPDAKRTGKFDNIEKVNVKDDVIFKLKNQQIIHIPFNHLNDYMRPACKACSDFTNVFADISFGGLGSPDKYTTVIPRTEKGKKIWEIMISHLVALVEDLKSMTLEEIHQRKF